MLLDLAQFADLRLDEQATENVVALECGGLRALKIREFIGIVGPGAGIYDDK